MISLVKVSYCVFQEIRMTVSFWNEVELAVFQDRSKIIHWIETIQAKCCFFPVLRIFERQKIAISFDNIAFVWFTVKQTV